MLSGTRTLVILPALVIALTVSSCTSTPETEATPSTEASPSASPSPSIEPAPELVLPTCDAMFSADMVATLTGEGRVAEASVTGPPSSNADTVVTFEGQAETVRCGWILPASESGSSTAIAFIDDATRSEIESTLTAGGFAASSVLGGSGFSVENQGELSSSTEFHLIVDGVWFFTLYFGGDAQALTVDAAEQLLP